MQDCIFCKIIRGALPAVKIYEDGHTLAFMDIGPIVKGHLLVIPKEHYADLVPLTELIDAGQLTPSIDATYTLAEAPVAMRHLEAGTVRGKITISMQ